MAQHALRGEDYKGFAPVAQGRAAQQMEILRRIRGLANLEIVASRELQKTFDARAGVFRTLAFVTMGQEQNHAGEESPLAPAGADELITHRLRDVGKAAKLSLPRPQCFRVVPAVAVFETQHPRLGKTGNVDFATRL